MLISTRGRYALRVLADLSSHGKGARIPLSEIAARQGISEKYLESIVSVLTKAGLLAGSRGKGGGYSLTRAPGKYTLGEILKLTEGSLSPVSCLENPDKPCERAAVCETLPVWQKLDALIDGFLESVTLADITSGGEKPANL